MKKIILLTTALLSQQYFSQVTFNGTKFEKNGTTYKLSKYNEVFKNQEAIDFVKKGRGNKTVGDIFAFTGGFGIGFGLVGALISPSESKVNMGYMGTYAYKNDKSGYWTILGVGAGLALVSIPFYSGANKNFKKAVVAENGETSTAFKPYFNVESAGSGVAMSYNF